MENVCDKIFVTISHKLRQLDFSDKAIIRRLTSEKYDFYKHISDSINEFGLTDATADNLTLYRILINAVSAHLMSYHAPAPVKHKLYLPLYELCIKFGQAYGVSNYEKHLDNIPKPLDCDISVDIIKELHSRDGITKEELASKYNVSTKTVQKYLHRLSDKKTPLRIGGQAVNLRLAHHKETSRTEERRFYTPDTLSPIILQLNVMQVGSLLQSLCRNYYSDNGGVIPSELALNVWCQLTEYVKERIRSVFAERDFEFAGFLDILDDESKLSTPQFISETEMIYSDEPNDYTNEEQLLFAYKNATPHDILLNNPPIALKNQRIRYDHRDNIYFALPFDNPNGKRINISPDDLKKISKPLK